MSKPPRSGDRGRMQSRKKNDAPTASDGPSAVAGGPSTVNMILLCLTLLGMGGIGGYYVFYTMFTNRCSDLVDDVERRHQRTRQELEDKYLAALEDKHKCIEDEGRERQVAELKGRLEGQSSLVVKHQELLEKHQETVERYTSLHSDHEEAVRQFETSRNDMAAKEEQIRALQQHIEDRQQELDRAERRQANKLDLSNKMVKKKIEENAALKAERDSCQAEQKMAALDARQMKKQLQGRSNVVCKARYGDGPYRVQFKVALPDGSRDSFVVEVDARKEMPHTVLTFLQMAEEGMFDDFSFLSTSTLTIEVGMSNKKKARAKAKLNAGAFGSGALLFTEASSTKSCETGSIGFDKIGPGFQVYTVPVATDSHCFGKVVRGQPVVTVIQETASVVGRVVDLLEVKLMNLAEAPGNGEL